MSSDNGSQIHESIRMLGSLAVLVVACRSVSTTYKENLSDG